MSDTNVIKMQDMTSFKWVMLNILGHDFMHDFLLNTVRTKKGKVEVGNKKVSIIKKVNKTCQAISKYLRRPNLAQSLSRGGGLFDNPAKETTIIGDPIINELIDNTYNEKISTTEGVQQSNYSSYEKELNHMLSLIDELNETPNKDTDELSKEDLSDYVNRYFQDLYTVKRNDSGEIISYDPKIIKIL